MDMFKVWYLQPDHLFLMMMIEVKSLKLLAKLNLLCTEKGIVRDALNAVAGLIIPICKINWSVLSNP